MPAVKNAQRRYRIIDRCIRNKYRPFPNKEDLIKACEEDLFGSDTGTGISESTLEKDLKYMREYLDAPIKFDRNSGGYYYTEENFSLEKIPLTDKELESLQFAAANLMAYRNLGVFQDFDLAIGKIFEEVNVKPSESNQRKIWFDKKEREVRGQEFLNPILEAMDNDLGLKIEYASASSGTIKQYVLHPHLLKEYDSLWYLIAENTERQIIQTFELGRIQNLQTHVFPSGQSFIPFDADAYFKYAFGITVPGSEPSQKIELQVFDYAQNLVKANPLHHSQKLISNGSSTSLTLNCYVTPELKSKIMSFGSGMLVKAPAFLAEWQKNEVKMMLERGDRK